MSEKAITFSPKIEKEMERLVIRKKEDYTIWQDSVID